jgi:hypothetical protein
MKIKIKIKMKIKTSHGGTEGTKGQVQIEGLHKAHRECEEGKKIRNYDS